MDAFATHHILEPRCDLDLQTLTRSSAWASEYPVSFIKTVQAVHEILW